MAVVAMTRDEHRKACIDAMVERTFAHARDYTITRVGWLYIMTSAFDAIPSAAARVNPVEATAEMIETMVIVLRECGWSPYPSWHHLAAKALKAAMAAGDLTNPREGKP
jgi:hypothetical protein